MSLTISGLIVLLISLILRYLGIEVINDDVTKAVNLLLEFGGLVVAYIGRYRQGDISVVGTKV